MERSCDRREHGLGRGKSPATLANVLRLNPLIEKPQWHHGEAFSSALGHFCAFGTDLTCVQPRTLRFAGITETT